MDGELIDFRLPYIGAHFDQDDLLAFLNDSKHGTHISRVHAPCGNYITAETDDGMQLWFQEDADDENCVCDFDVHFKSSMRMKLRLDGWIGQRDGGLYGLAHMWNEAGNTEFPLNFDVVNAGFVSDYESGEFVAQVAAFGYNITLFPDIESFRVAETGYSTESCIPIGTFPVNENDDDWKPSAHAILTGTIKSVKRCVNAYTGGEYYHLRVDCIGLKLDVLLKAASIESEPVVGGFIHGTFYLTARLFPPQYDECLTPCFSIETAEVVENLNSMTFREQESDIPNEGWELFAYPIMPDGNILLVFQNASEVDDEDDNLLPRYYRLLRYDNSGNIIDRRQTTLIGGVLNTAYYDSGGHLHIVFHPVGSDEVCMFDMDDDIEPHPVCSFGENISRIITDSKDNVFVGRNYSFYPGYLSGLISVYNAHGEKQFESHSKNYCCSELVLDSEDSVWCLTEPVTSLHKITPKDTHFQSDCENFPLSYILALAISKSGSRMLCECEAAPSKSRFYMLTRKEGRYRTPTELNPPLLLQEDCQTYGMCATSKDNVLFNVDGILYLFKLEDERCSTLADLRRICVKKRTKDSGKNYNIKIDPSVPVAESSLSHYVEPILRDMRDMAGESLTISFSEVRKSDAVSFIQVARNGANYHLEIAVDDANIDCPCRIFALLDADFDTVFAAFKTIIVESGCPDFSKWIDYTEVVFGKVESNGKPSENTGKSPHDLPIEALDLSVRSYNRLLAHGIMTVGQLVNCPINELTQIKGLGKKCLSEIRSALSKYGYELTQ